MKPTTKKYFIVICIAALLTATWVLVSQWPSRESTAVATVSSPPSPPEGSQFATTPPSITRESGSSSSAARTAHATRANLIDQLSSSGNPHDAFQAYRFVASCVEAQRRDAFVKSLPAGKENDEVRAVLSQQAKQDAEACDGVRASQIKDRFKNLEAAAKAGVTGAAAAFLQEGPFGDIAALEHRPDDPLVSAWAEQAVEQLKASSKKGDETAIIALMQMYDNGGPVVKRDPEQALSYWVAASEILKIRRGTAMPNMEAALATIRKDLTPQQIASATETGQKLFNDCCTPDPNNSGGRHIAY